jgi:O-antigen/teichoic acid export membrane protein
MDTKKKNNIFLGGFKDAFWYTFALVGSKLIQFLVIPILVANVLPDEFAKYDLFLTYSSFLIVIFTLGMDSGLGVKCTEHKDNIQKICFYYTGSLKIVFFIFLFFLFLWLIALLVGLNDMSFYLYTLFYAFILSVYSIILGFQRWLGNVKMATFIILIINVLGYFLGLLALFISNYNTNYLLMGIALGSLIGVLICLYLTRTFLNNFFQHSLNEEFLHFFKISIPIVGASFGIQSRRLLERFTVLYFFDTVELGKYALLSRIVQIPEIGIQTMGNAFFPRILKDYNTIEGKKTSHLILLLFLIFIFIGSIFTYFFSTQIILMIGDNTYQAYSKFILPVFIFTILNCIHYFSGFGFFIKAKTNQYSIVIIGAVLFSAVMSFISLYFIKSISVLIITYLISSVLYSISYLFFSEKLYKMEYNTKIYYSIISLGLLGIAFILFN